MLWKRKQRKKKQRRSEMGILEEFHVFKMLEETGATIPGHFVLKHRGKKDSVSEIPGSGDHSGFYVNKDALFPFANATQFLGREIAERFCFRFGTVINVVAAPAVGAISLASYVRDAIFQRLLRQVFAVYAEDGPCGKIFKRGFDKFIPGKNVLVVEDITTTGGSLKQVIDSAKDLGGIVVGAAVIVNRGGITAADLGVSRLESLVNLSSEQTRKWPLEECPLCKKGVEITPTPGHGSKFLENRELIMDTVSGKKE